jgi:polysaccharide biosynthesis/export protein
MAVEVRGVSDLLKAKALLVAALMGVCLWPRLAYGQKVETPQQTNEKILQLASRARTQPVDIPIGVGDLVHIDVFDVPELSRDVRVSQTGDISYPLLPGLIHVAGLTTFQLEKQMEQLFLENGLVSHPQVSVFVKEQNSQPISVVGAVQRPMVYQVVRPTTLLQILADAGGIADDAGGDVIITRPAPESGPGPSAAEGTDPRPASSASTSTQGTDSTPASAAAPASANGADPRPASASDPSADPPPAPQVITIHLQDLLDSADSKFDVAVHGGDVIRVPKAGIIYVLGSGIAAPGGYVLQGHGQDVTVLRVVALAHGLTGFAKADDAVILRNNPDTGKRDEIHVQIKKIEKNQIPDVLVKSNDILYIPDSAGKKTLARVGQSAIGIGTSVAIYRVAY